MTDKNGYVRLWRKLQKSDMYKSLNAAQRDVMINCLMLANHKSSEWEWQKEIFECEPGQFITSLFSLKKVCAKDVTIQNVRTAIQKLEKWGFLTNKSTKTGRLITIVNWAEYQHSENETNKDSNKELTKHQQSTNKKLTTNKNDKIFNKNDKEYIYSQISSETKKLFTDYINIYKSKNKTKTITDDRHLKLLEEIYSIYSSKKFDYNGEEYELTATIFISGIKEIIKRNVDNLNYAKVIWIGLIERRKQNEHKQISGGFKGKEEKDGGDDDIFNSG